MVMATIGILNINKPPGCSSRDVVDRVEQIVRPAKAGHAGTLDPLASGVLVICVGKATRLIRYVQRMEKCYHATFLLGRRSETDDIEGVVSELSGAPVPTRTEVDAALRRFVGQILQRPPAHSAVKIAGRRAYQLARQGKAVELAPRRVEIHAIEVMRFEYPELELAIRCGSGTYVRSVGRDLAESLGTAAVMTALERTAIGDFRVAESLAMDQLSEPTFQEHLQSAIVALGDMPRVTLNDAQLTDVKHGRPIRLEALEIPEESMRGAVTSKSSSEWAAVDDGGQLVAILYERTDGQLWPRHYLGH
jgi:tRNA pseudouridine55 synthase